MSTPSEPLFELMNLIFGLESEKQKVTTFAESIQALFHEHHYELEETESKVVTLYTSAWLDAENTVISSTQGQQAIIVAELKHDTHELMYVCPQHNTLVTVEFDAFCLLQDQLSQGSEPPVLYLMNSTFDVHPKIKHRSNEITLSDASNLLSELDLEQDMNGHDLESELQKVCLNTDEQYSLDVRAAAHRLLNTNN